MTAPVDNVIQAAKAGTAGPQELYEALAGAPVLFAVATGQEDTALPWILRDGDMDHGVFCTAPEYADILTDVPAFAQMSGRDLGAAWPNGLHAVVNPGTPLAITFDADAMHAIGAANARLSAGTTYAVGAPAESPQPALVEAVRGALRNVGGAQHAYLFQFAPSGGTSRLVCGLVLSPGADPNVVIPPIADAVLHSYPAATSLDYTPLDGRLLEQVTEYVAPVS